MKKLIPIILILFINNIVKAQPTSEMVDIMYGSTIEFESIIYKDTTLIIKDWLTNKDKNIHSLYILGKTVSEKNPFNIFSIKQSEIDNTYKYLYFIYGEDLMRVKILKNKSHLSINIKKIHFKTGTYILNLEELSKKYNDKDRIEINEFPCI